MILTIFNYTNTKYKPFVNRELNDLESLSIQISMITVFCGICYINDDQYIVNEALIEEK